MLQKQKQKKTGKEVNKSIVSNTMAFFAFIHSTDRRKKKETTKSRRGGGL